MLQFNLSKLFNSTEFCTTFLAQILNKIWNAVFCVTSNFQFVFLRKFCLDIQDQAFSSLGLSSPPSLGLGHSHAIYIYSMHQLYFFLYIYPFIYISIFLSIYLTIVGLSFHLFIHPSIYSPYIQSIYPYISNKAIVKSYKDLLLNTVVHD